MVEQDETVKTQSLTEVNIKKIKKKKKFMAQIKHEFDHGVIYQGDCLELMKDIPDGSVDLIAIDPPYMVTDLKFDKIGFDIELVSLEMLRVLKHNGYLAVFALVLLQAEFAKYFHMRFSGAWIKDLAGMRTHSAKKPRNQWELYCVFCHKKHKISDLTWNHVKHAGKPYRRAQKKNRDYPRGGKDQIERAGTSNWTKDDYVINNTGERLQTDVIYAPSKMTMKHQERTCHPTQKPIKAISILIQWLSNPGETVLDCFIGSGTTAIAAYNTGRRFIGMEKDEDIYKMAVNRIDTETKQKSLWPKIV